MSPVRIEPSPIGALTLVSNGSAVTELWLPGTFEGVSDYGRSDTVLDEAARQLRAYFAGELRVFDLPLAPRGTPFQQRVWQALLEIPYGRTMSYAQLAADIGETGKNRAVGHANGSNRIPIIIPCHRLIGTSGHLTGYGGGLERKRWLLDLEATSGSAEADLG
jgi:methylated-DNA-[protein]-cysteine S-methyltransferase